MGKWVLWKDIVYPCLSNKVRLRSVASRRRFQWSSWGRIGLAQSICSFPLLRWPMLLSWQFLFRKHLILYYCLSYIEAPLSLSGSGDRKFDSEHTMETKKTTYHSPYHRAPMEKLGADGIVMPQNSIRMQVFAACSAQ